jgi:hypothetical protein
MLNIGLGAGLIIIGLAAQFLLSKRSKNNKVRQALSWVAWIFVAVGGEAVTADISSNLGVTSVGAAVASWVMLLFITVDVADKRPDWLAFILIAICPTFMRLAGGGSGQIFNVLLMPLDWAASGLGAFLGA